jgi:hypothetical protein
MAIRTLRQKEVLERLNQIGIPMKYGTLLNYEKQKLITPPRRGSGYGGKWAEYDIWAVAEVATAWKLIHGKYESDRAMTQIFTGRPPSINAKAVALARAVFLERMKGTMTEEGIKKIDWEDLQELQNMESGLLNDLSGHKYLVRYLAYVYRLEYLEATKKAEMVGLG